VSSWLALFCALGGAAAAAPDGDPAYAGSSACAPCHTAESAAWRGSHHDLAIQEASEQTVLGDFADAEFEHQGVTTRFHRKGDRFLVHTEDAQGKLADFEVRYVFGIEPLQQYLLPGPGGRLQVLGVSWDSRPMAAGGQRWFHVYGDEPIPAGDALHWTGPNQNWNHMCAECHSTHLRKGYDAKADRFDTTWSELDVACEACHGPGAGHVAWAKAGASQAKDLKLGLALRFEPFDSPGRSFSTDPQTGMPRRAQPLPNSLELDACARCHSRRSPIVEDYEHGSPLFDTHRAVPIDPALYFADGQIREEVYVWGSFVQSAMHAAGVTCSDCHDSHSGALRAPGNALCGRCHTPERYDSTEHHHHRSGSEGAACVACHMPERTYMQVDARHDHSLRVPRPDLSDELGTPNACTSCHLAASNSWAASAIAKWRGGKAPDAHWGSAIHAGLAGGPEAEAALLRLLADPETPAIARATAVTLLPAHSSPKSGPAFEAALEDPDPQVRVEAVTAFEMLGVPQALMRLLPLLDDPVRGVRLEAARALAQIPGEHLSEAQRGRRAELLREYRAVQRMDADRAQARMRLASLAIAEGYLEEAEQELKAAQRLEPSFVPAYVNLSDVHRMQGRDQEGEALLRAALELSPGNADVSHALGLLLVRQKRMREALPQLERAATGNPNAPRYAFVYALALDSVGDRVRALEVLREARARHPGDREIASLLEQFEAAAQGP
jgi:tetratricopeptide (TPR) repeat protein